MLKDLLQLLPWDNLLNLLITALVKYFIPGILGIRPRHELIQKSQRFILLRLVLLVLLCMLLMTVFLIFDPLATLVIHSNPLVDSLLS